MSSPLPSELRTLQELQTCTCMLSSGVPRLLPHPTGCTVQTLGKDLLTIVKEKGKFSLKTVLMIAVKVIKALEEVHSSGYLHGNLSPECIVTAQEALDSRLYLAGFQCSGKYAQGHLQAPYQHHSLFLRKSQIFSSISSLHGLTPSRRDDLESLGYVLIYLLKGHLPWDSSPYITHCLPAFLDERESCLISEIYPDMEPEFTVFLRYCKGLKSEDKPDYEYLRGLFTDLGSRLQLEFDGVYDWTPIAPYRRHSFLQVGSTFHGSDSEKRRISISLTTEEASPMQADTPVLAVSQLPVLRKHTLKRFPRTINR